MSYRTTRLNELCKKDEAKKENWERLGVSVQWGDADSAYYAALTSHEASGHDLYKMYGEANCTTCGWKVVRMNWEGFEFDNNGRPRRYATLIDGPVNEEDEYKRRKNGMLVIDADYR